MPSTIKTPAEYYAKLRDAIRDMKKLVAACPGERALEEILSQMELAEQWTDGGQPPTLEQKAQLGFGFIASKYLDEIDQELAQRIYSIASYIMYWD
jgi:hypothetical protein